MKRYRAIMAMTCLSLATDAQASAAPYSKTETAELLGRAAIEQLNAEYTYDLDHGQTDKLAAMFTEHGTLYFADNDVRLTGRAAIADYYARRPKGHTTRHASSNLDLHFTDSDHATGTRYLIYFSGAGAPPMPAEPHGVLEYAETYEREADGVWRYASRTATGVFGSAPYSKQQQQGSNGAPVGATPKHP